MARNNFGTFEILMGICSSYMPHKYLQNSFKAINSQFDLVIWMAKIIESIQ